MATSLWQFLEGCASLTEVNCVLTVCDVCDRSEQLGIFSWTTEFWDPVHAATGKRASTKSWYLGYAPQDLLAIAAWADKNAPGSVVDWYPVLHPQLGPVQLGGIDTFRLITNPPMHMLKDEVCKHAEFAVYQACLSPKLEILLATAEHVGPFSAETHIFRVKIGNNANKILLL